VCRDTDELAVNGKADGIISGDADLPTLDTFREIPNIAPAASVSARVR
jgi:predicted nucleic acid-binding protein